MARAKVALLETATMLRHGCRMVALLVAVIASSVPARVLPLARAFAGPSLAGEDVKAVQVSPDGRFVAYLKPPQDSSQGAVLWLMPLAGGKPRMILDARDLGRAAEGESEARMKFLERRYIINADAITYRWSDSGRTIVVTYADDLYLLSVADAKVRRLTQTEGAELDPRIAPDDAHVSYVRGRDLFIRAVAGGDEHKVAADASDTIGYGIAEFVAQEEMRRFTGQWWSPNGSRLAYTRINESAVRIIPRVRIDANATSVVNERYPLTGTPNAKVELFVRAAEGSAVVKADLGSNTDIYLANVVWSADGRTIYALRQSRDQKRLDLLAIDPFSGTSRVILTETSPTWVDLERDFRPLRDGNFLWGSARSGWRHLYLYDRGGTLIRPVTQGAWRIANVGVIAPEDYSSITGVDERRGLVYFIASKDTPVERQLYVVSYRKPGEPRQLTTGHGWWTPAMGGALPAAFVGGYSDATTPPNTGIYDLKGRRVAWLAANRLDGKHPYAPYLDHRPSYEFGTIKAADGQDLQYVIAKPSDFDPRRRYPVIIRVYGGPNVWTVSREWRTANEQLLTQAGYIVFQLDNRGGFNRSEAFEHALAGNLGGINTEDQKAGVSFLKTLPFVDAERIGMMGWSFGGYMTVRMLTEPGSGIRAGAAGGVPSDFALYDTHYTERFLGTPQAQPEAYHASALLPRAKDLHGSLMLLHGLSDDNVVVPNFTALVAELEKQGKTFETVVYPGMAHVPRGSDKLMQMWTTYLDFFARRMPPSVSPAP